MLSAVGSKRSISFTKKCIWLASGRIAACEISSKSSRSFSSDKSGKSVCWKRNDSLIESLNVRAKRWLTRLTVSPWCLSLNCFRCFSCRAVCDSTSSRTSPPYTKAKFLMCVGCQIVHILSCQMRKELFTFQERLVERSNRRRRQKQSKTP